LPDVVLELFDDYAARYARGERPDVEEYLSRAGAKADELARLIDGYLERAPVPEADQQTAVMMDAWIKGEAPLVALRASRGIRRERVVRALVERLQLDPAKRVKVDGYYHELENGLLQSGRVDRSVWVVVADVLGARVSELLTWGPRRPVAEPGAPAFFRADARAVAERPVPAAAAADQPPATAPEPDDVDRLFGKAGE
jgi:hypothetical protein